MNKILLFYKYIRIEDPQLIADWQRALCTKLNLKGRIIVAHEGINATVGGATEAVYAYKEAVDTHPLFGGIDFKESSGTDADFPRLSIKIKQEIVRLGVDPEVITVKDTGVHLKPSEVHEKITHNKELVILDTRNTYESKIGTFENAVVPPIHAFRDLPAYIDQHEDLFKDKEVLMFCTGGVRCERATAYLKVKGIAKEVYHIEGGIQRYIEQFPDGYFRGKNFVFDARLTVRANEDVLAHCERCSTPYDTYSNCAYLHCPRRLLLLCTTCAAETENTCSTACQEKITQAPHLRIDTQRDMSCEL